MEKTNRRAFLAGLGLLVASPAIVRASSLMPINTKLTVDATAPLFKTASLIDFEYDSDDFVRTVIVGENQFGRSIREVLPLGRINPPKGMIEAYGPDFKVGVLPPRFTSWVPNPEDYIGRN